MFLLVDGRRRERWPPLPGRRRRALSLVGAPAPGSGPYGTMTSSPPPPAAPNTGGVVRLYLVLTAAALVLFLVLRVLAPWLVSRHDDLSLAAAVVLVLACPVVAFLAARTAVRAWRRR